MTLSLQSHCGMAVYLFIFAMPSAMGSCRSCGLCTASKDTSPCLLLEPGMLTLWHLEKGLCYQVPAMLGSPGPQPRAAVTALRREL